MHPPTMCAASSNFFLRFHPFPFSFSGPLSLMHHARTRTYSRSSPPNTFSLLSELFFSFLPLFHHFLSGVNPTYTHTRFLSLSLALSFQQVLLYLRVSLFLTLSTPSCSDASIPYFSAVKDVFAALNKRLHTRNSRIHSKQ